MNLLDSTMPTLVDSAFPIVGEDPCFQDSPLLFWLLKPVAHDNLTREIGDVGDD